MTYREYHYGSFRKEIRSLLRKRLMIKERIRYHNSKAEKWSKKLPEVERELEELLEKAKNSVG